MNRWDTYPKYYIQRTKQENVDLWCLNVNASMMHRSRVYDMLSIKKKRKKERMTCVWQFHPKMQLVTSDNHFLKPTSEIFKYDDALGFLTEHEMNLMTKDN